MQTLLAIIAALGLYSQTFYITEINYTNDEVICVDYATENIWSFKGTEDWDEGDVISAIMTDNGTESIYDDEFISVRYSGYIY